MRIITNTHLDIYIKFDTCDLFHDDVIKWKHFPRCWPFVRGIHRWSPVNSPHKVQWRGALMFSLISTRIHDWVNNGEAGDLRRYRAHYDVTVMCTFICIFIFGHWNPLWPNDAIWRHRSGSTLVQVLACCLTASSHYLDQSWLIISKIQLHSSEGNFTRYTSVINDWNWHINWSSKMIKISQGTMS